MARILFGSIPAAGHLNPLIAIAQRLQQAGHAVAFACHPQMAPTLEKAGLPLLTSFLWGEPLLDTLETIARQPSRQTFDLPGAGRVPTRFFFADLARGVEQLLELFQSWQPDLLVSDLLFPPGAIAAEAAHLPYATSCPMVLPIPSKALPPFSFGFSPRERLGWAWHFGNIILNRLVTSGDKIVNRVRQRYRLSPIRGSLFYVSPYLVLAYTTEAFEYPRPDLPPQVHYVGPSISQQRDDTDAPFPWNWLGEKPTVYATFGTIKTGRRHWFDKVMEASQGQPWQMVVSVGRHQDPAQWAGAPANVLVRNFVPHSTLFRRVQAIVSHGGSNTTTEALAAGIPMAITPAGADNSEVAQRVVEAGAGLRFDMERTSVLALREIIRRLLQEPAFRENAQRIAQDYARCDGPGASAALLLRLAETRAPLLRPADRRPTVYAGEIA